MHRSIELADVMASRSTEVEKPDQALFKRRSVDRGMAGGCYNSIFVAGDSSRRLLSRTIFDGMGI